MTPRTSDKSAGCESGCGKIHRWGQRYCPAYGQTCGSCGKMNHFATACKSRIRRGRRYEQRPRPRNPRGKINQVTDEVTQRPEEDQYEMEILTIWDDGPQAEEEIHKVHTTPCRQLFVWIAFAVLLLTMSFCVISGKPPAWKHRLAFFTCGAILLFFLISFNVFWEMYVCDKFPVEGFE